MKEAQNRHKNLKTTLSIAGLVLLITLSIMGITLAYHSGYEAGESRQSDETHTTLAELGQTISEKTKTLASLNELNSTISPEADPENIEEYLKKLDEIINSISNFDIKSTLDEYKSAWIKFQETYASENNSAIEDELKNLHASADDAAKKITEIYNSAITSIAQKLPD